MMNRWHLTTDHMQLLPGPAIATHLTFLSPQAEHPLLKTCSGPEDTDRGVYYSTFKVFTYLTRSGEEIEKEERNEPSRLSPIEDFSSQMHSKHLWRKLALSLHQQKKGPSQQQEDWYLTFYWILTIDSFARIEVRFGLWLDPTSFHWWLMEGRMDALGTIQWIR